MTTPLIWIHEEALRLSHPIFKEAPSHTKAIFIWDRDYFREAAYSLKRLVFIYETLCELPIDIVQDSIIEGIVNYAPSCLYVPATQNPLILRSILALKVKVPLQVIKDDSFVFLTKKPEFRSFFHYWKKAEKSAFLQNGGVDDKGD